MGRENHSVWGHVTGGVPRLWGDSPTPVHTQAALAGLSGLSEEEKGWMGRRMCSGIKWESEGGNDTRYDRISLFKNNKKCKY